MKEGTTIKLKHGQCALVFDENVVEIVLPQDGKGNPEVGLGEHIQIAAAVACRINSDDSFVEDLIDWTIEEAKSFNIEVSKQGTYHFLNSRMLEVGKVVKNEWC